MSREVLKVYNIGINRYLGKELIYQLVINTLTGAGTGYITNNIAIKMLFKKYFGRFGGIIEDTHDEFVENISLLIEKDLINHHTLDDEFNSEKFHNYITELVKDMFLHSLPKNSKNLKDIDGIYETTNNLIEFLKSNRQKTKDLKKKIASKPLKDALSYPQVLHICENATEILHKNRDSYIGSLVAPLKEFKMEELLTHELLFKLTKNIEDIIYKVDISEFDTHIDRTVYQLLELVKIDEIIAVTKEETQNLYFKEMFLSKDKTIKELLRRLIEIALSDDGREAIGGSVKAILKSLSEVEVPVLSLFDDDIKESIRVFVKNELPNIITKIVEFMDQNEKDLEELINDSIDKALDDGIFSGLKKKIVSIFYENIVVDFKVLNMVKSYMHEYREMAEEEIAAQVLNILENKSIGELYQVIANKNIITPKKVTSLIVHNIKNFSVDREIKLIDTILNRQVKDYTDVDLGFVKEKMLPYSLQKIKQEYLYSDKIKEKIFKESKKLIEEFKIKTIDEILGKRVDAIVEKISNSIDSNELLNMILSNANSILKKDMNELVEIDGVNLDYRKYIDGVINKKSIKDIIVYIQSQEVYVATKNALIKVVIDNLEEILKGNVSEAVKKELAKLPPSQIKDMVEEFMGEELKPINYFGAVLGGAAGAGISFVTIPVWANPFVYGVVGVATNYLAIKMLFQPYKPLKIGKMKVPFSEGVLPSNKEKMANKMSEFVDDFMLNGTSIQEFFLHNSDKLKDFIKLHLSKNNYAIIDKLIHQKSNISDTANEVITLLFSFLDKNQEVISDKIFKIAMEYFDKREEYSHQVSDFVYKEFMKKNFKEFLFEQFEKYVDKELSLKFLKQDIFAKLDKFIEKAFDTFVTILSDSTKIRELILPLESSFEEFIDNKFIGEVVDDSLKQKLSKKINSSLKELFYGQETLNELLSFFTKGEFSSQSKLSDMINGMLPRIIENNLHLIIDETLLPTLKNNKKLIREEIMQKVPFGAGWVVKRDVNRTINIILDKKIPLFLEEKIKEINLIVQDILSSQLIELGYTQDVINQKKVDDLMKTILSDKNFELSFAKAMNLFVDSIFNMKLKTILQIFNINKLTQIYDLFEPQISRIVGALNKNIKTEKKSVLESIKGLVKDDISKTLLESLTVGNVLKDIDKRMLLREFEYLEKNLKHSKEFEKSMRAVIENFINLFMKKEFLDKEVFKNDLDRFLKESIKEREQLRDILVPFFKEFLQNINTILDLKLKENLIEIVVDSAFLSIDKKIMDLMKAVDFKKVITKEIQEMHPKELEDMFYSFAGAYFNKLILYGALGFLFGLGTIF